MPKSKPIPIEHQSGPIPLVIRLTKGPCFGTCPVFTLELFENGKVVFMPQMFTVQKDTVETIWPLAPIQNLFQQSGFDALDSEYIRPVSDIPTFSLRYKSKTVRWNAGAPKVLYDLMKVLDELVLSEGWVALESDADQADGTVELIVQLAQSGKGTSWMNIYEKYGLSLIRGLDSQGEYLLMQYDQTTISPTEMIRLLRKDEHISAVSRSRITEIRN